MRTVSFRALLKGTVSDFLIKEEMHCPNTEEGLLELIVALSSYTEEGQPLFPQVVLCNDLEITLRLLQCSDPLNIGSGPRDEATMIEALKRCAPLAHDDWAVFLLRLEDRIEYGVFRIPYSPTALDIRDTIKELIGESESPNIILATQLADKAVELMGTRSGILNVYLSAKPEDSPSPRNAIDDLVVSCCADVSPGIRDQLQSFLRTTLSVAIHHSHGALLVVLPQGQNPKDITSDGVLFESPISLSQIVDSYESQPNDLNLATLVAYRNLLIGMLNCDGIVMIDSQCQLIGYNLFVKIEDHAEAQSRGNRPEGGARHRAYGSLKVLQSKKVIKACFIHSSDGSSEFYKG